MMSNLEKLVYMANQIARNFEAIGHEAAAQATADHIASFWDPRMKALIFAHLDQGGGDLAPSAADALRQLRDRGNPASQTRATEFNAVHESGHADAG
jgi:formate dehydrogenase subunit delta